MKENFHVRFGERGGETHWPQGQKVRSAPTLRSMHFGLYAFDLFEQIYAEAWDLEEKLGEKALGRLTDLHRRIYYAHKHPHPYLIETETNTFPEVAFPLYWEGRTTPEKADWAELRLAVLKRDDYHCVECGSPNHLHVHHIRSRKKGGTTQMDNLQTMCESCHAKTPSWGRPKGTSGSTQSRRAG